MLQLVQNLKTGAILLIEAPYPCLSKGQVLVQTHYSVISSGTEGGQVRTAQKSLIGKAKEKPEQLKQVIESIKVEGLRSTYKKVMNKLDFPTPRGYSAAGQIIDIAPDINHLSVGDYVACGGQGHAEIIAVPKNLCVKVPENLSLRYACFTTIGAIAMQGVRQANLKIGEICAVIGLGLIGQLTVQILKAAGILTIGIDIDEQKVKLAQRFGADLAITRNNPTIIDTISNLANGYGVDAVIITAATKSTDPVELAGTIARKKAKIVIVGDVPTGFSRENYYKKELALLMSTSYGPGRYDPNYEITGLDYPYHYVRWTENRNMQAFLYLIQQNKLNIDGLISHEFDFKNAIQAYNTILKKQENFVGILLKYDSSESKKNLINYTSPKIIKPDKINLGFIGAGSYAQKTLLPYTQKLSNFIGVATATSNNAYNIAKKYNFSYASCNYLDILNDTNINTVFIATSHNLHAQQVIKALENNKNVFVEKPLCITETELEQIKNIYQKKNLYLITGFNRRFAPLIIYLNKFFDPSQPKSILIRINAGKIPADHWIQNKDIGGGRIIGEVCHFIDLALFLANSSLSKISAFVMNDPLNLMDTLTINMSFTNSSIATIAYFANGSAKLKKEYIEVYSNGITALINDFKNIKVFTKNKTITKKLSAQDKGNKNIVQKFLLAIKNAQSSPIPFEQIYQTTKATFDVIASIKNNKIISY